MRLSVYIIVFLSVAHNSCSKRRRFAVDIPRLELGQVVRLCGTGTFEARENIERDLSGDFWDRTGEYDSSAQDCQGSRLGREFLAEYKEEQAERLSESTTILPYGCG